MRSQYGWSIAILLAGACDAENDGRPPDAWATAETDTGDAADDDASEPITLVEDDNADGVNGSVVIDGRAIAFETAVVPDEEGQRVVARFVDADGSTLAVASFGANLDAAWLEDIGDVDPDHPGRVALVDARAALAELDVTAAHRDALVATVDAIPAVLALESNSDADERAAQWSAFSPEVASAVSDFYAYLASRELAERALAPGALVVEEQELRFSGNCMGFDVHTRLSTVLGQTAFRFHQWRQWCYDPDTHVMNGPGERGAYFTDVASTFNVQGWWVDADYWMSEPYQHYYRTTAKVENCVFKYGCIGHYYPYVESWVDGWGSWLAYEGV